MANQKRIVLNFPPFSPPHRISCLAAETKHGNESGDKGFAPIKDVSDLVPSRGSETLRWMMVHNLWMPHTPPHTPPNSPQWDANFLMCDKECQVKSKSILSKYDNKSHHRLT